MCTIPDEGQMADLCCKLLIYSISTYRLLTQKKNNKKINKYQILITHIKSTCKLFFYPEYSKAISKNCIKGHKSKFGKSKLDIEVESLSVDVHMGHLQCSFAQEESVYDSATLSQHSDYFL
jgi:hypothetical protein